MKLFCCAGEVPEQAYFIIPCVVAAVTLACYLSLGMSPRTHTHGDGVDSPQQDSQEPPGSTGRLLSPCSHSCYLKSFIVAFQLIRAQERLVINRRSASKATRPQPRNVTVAVKVLTPALCTKNTIRYLNNSIICFYFQRKILYFSLQHTYLNYSDFAD